jgi:hypothetical protein
MDIDLSEIEQLSASLAKIPEAVKRDARPVVQKGLLNIKDETRKNIPSRYWNRLAYTVTYSTTAALSGEVGYEDRGQGELAGIYEFGSARRAPHPTLFPAAKAEAPRFEKALADLAAKALGSL